MRLEPRRTGGERGGPARTLRQGRAGGGEEDRHQHPARPAGHPGEAVGQRVAQGGGLGLGQPVALGQHRPGGGREGGAGIAVPDPGVEGVEVGLGRRQRRADRRDRPGHGRIVRGHRLLTLPREAIGQGARRGRDHRHRERPGRGVGRGRQRRLRVGVEGHQRERGAVHVERRHRGGRPEEEAHPGAEGRGQHRPGEDLHLQRRGTAEVVHQEGEGAFRRQGPGEARGHQPGEVGGRWQGDAFDAGLAVDAEAELGLAGGEAGFGRPARQGAARDRDAEGADPGGGGPRGGRHLGERAAGFGGVARHLVDEERAGDAAGLRRAGDRDVVGDRDRLDREAEGPGPLGGEPEVQPVAGVVLDDEKASRRPGHRQDPGQHRIDRGRGEHVAADCRGEEAAPDEARMGRLVARAAAGDEGDPVRRPAGPQHDADRRIAVEPGETPAAGAHEAVHRLRHQGGAVVDEVGHPVGPPLAAHGRGAAARADPAKSVAHPPSPGRIRAAGPERLCRIRRAER